jgi:hypothetical protein
VRPLGVRGDGLAGPPAGLPLAMACSRCGPLLGPSASVRWGWGTLWQAAVYGWPMAHDLALATEAGCALAIGAYPRFRYDGRGGGGLAVAGASLADGWQSLVFDSATLSIPPLSARTTRFLGLPLAPGLRIVIQPRELRGRWHPPSGAVELLFLAHFQLQVVGRTVAPDLVVATQLATGAVGGRRHRAQGTPLDGEGRGVLVGIATVAPTGTGWLDRFLGLPDEALAELRCQFRQGGVP